MILGIRSVILFVFIPCGRTASSVYSASSKQSVKDRIPQSLVFVFWWPVLRNLYLLIDCHAKISKICKKAPISPSLSSTTRKLFNHKHIIRHIPLEKNQVSLKGTYPEEEKQHKISTQALNSCQSTYRSDPVTGNHNSTCSCLQVKNWVLYSNRNYLIVMFYCWNSLFAIACIFPIEKWDVLSWGQNTFAGFTQAHSLPFHSSFGLL